MSCPRRRSGSLALAAMLVATAVSSATSSPQIRGPLPDTATKGVLAWDVADARYVAEEFLVSGTADVFIPVAMADAPNMRVRDNVHDMRQRDFTVRRLQKHHPYPTRLIVYRPAQAARFSGNVVVQTLHP